MIENLTRLLLFFIQSCHITNWYGRSEKTFDLVILLAQKERFVKFEILCNFTNFYYDFFKGASLPILNQLNDPIDRPVEYRPTQNQVYDPRYEFWIFPSKNSFSQDFFKLGGFSKVKLTKMENTDLDFSIEDHLTKLCLDGPELWLLAEQD